VNRARIAARLAAEAAASFDQDLAAGVSEPHERESYIEAWVSDGLADAEYEAAEEREAFGLPEDTPSLQSADLWGTGEGRYHGIIG
jgi:hypothetical protein